MTPLIDFPNDQFLVISWFYLCALVGSAGAVQAQDFPASTATQTGIFDGVWQSQGYGWVLDVTDGAGPIYEISTVSRLESSDYAIGDGLLYALGEDDDDNPVRVVFGSLALESDTLQVTLADETVMTFTRIAAVPERPIQTVTDNPVATFEVFWHSLNEHFAFFDLHPEIDWQMLYDQARPLVDATTSEEDLFEILAELFTLLEDRHGGLLIPEADIEYSPVPEPGSIWMAERFADYLPVLVSYMDDGDLTVLGNDNMIAGAINGSIGYLNILQYYDYAEDEPTIEADAFAEAVDAMLTAFQEMSALIIDLRLNPGGYDHLGRVLAGRLIEEEHVGFYKQARVGDETTFAQGGVRMITPAGVPFVGKPVVVLTSKVTSSAAEVQAMVLKGLPNVTLIGEATRGGFSNILGRQLPNGWQLEFSNERYLFRDGTNYEEVGIPPDIEEIPSEMAMEQGHDNVLDRALHHLSVALPNEGASVPESFVLHQNYPNPFNPVTTIAFTLPSAQPITLEVYDPLGRRVATLLNDQWQPSGRHHVAFDATGLASGLYLYRMTANQHVTTRPMTLLK